MSTITNQTTEASSRHLLRTLVRGGRDQFAAAGAKASPVGTATAQIVHKLSDLMRRRLLLVFGRGSIISGRQRTTLWSSYDRRFVLLALRSEPLSSGGHWNALG